MNKKLDKLSQLEGLSADDLALATGGQSGAATALDIKRKQLQDQTGNGGPTRRPPGR